MIIKSLFPLSAAAPQLKTDSLNTLDAIGLKNIFRPKALGLSFQDSATSFLYSGRKRRSYFEEPPYDFDTILKAIDTDSYVKMAFSKYQELFWKEGWDINSENQDAVDYIWERIDIFEEVMGVAFEDFLSDITDQLIKFSNVFIVKARGNIRPLFKGTLDSLEYENPISGFYIIPTETVRIFRDKYNKPVAYKQALDDFEPRNDKNREPRWSADEVIHLHLDKKPGRAFGTPFVINVLDDIIALRQIEEDIQNLVHRDLFPLYKYQVGTEDKPSSPEEIEQAAEELHNLRVEGGLILPERHDVEVIGANNHALNANPYLKEFKQRVITGMGLSPHHLGMMSEGGNRSITETLDKALYDRVKRYQSYLEDAIRLYIFNPLLREGGFDPMVSPGKVGVSDRCFFRFREIDIDSQVKLENHFVNMFLQNAITFDELRQKLQLDPEVNPEELYMVMQHHLALHLAASTANAQAAGNNDTASRPNTKTPAVKGTPNLPNLTRGTGNKVQPANQHGRRLSPNIRHLDNNVLNDIKETLNEEEE